MRWCTGGFCTLKDTCVRYYPPGRDKPLFDEKFQIPPYVVRQTVVHVPTDQGSKRQVETELTCEWFVKKESF